MQTTASSLPGRVREGGEYIAMSNTLEVFRSADIIEILRALDYGTAMFRFKGRREPLRKLFCLKLETFEIQQFPITSSHSRKSPQPEEYGVFERN